MNLKKIWHKNIGRFHDDFVKLSKKYNRPVWYFYADALINKLRNGTGPVVYMSWGMFRMNQMERAQYLGDEKRRKIVNMLNTNPDRESMFSNKANFNRLFAEFVKRDWLYAPDSTEAEIKSFLEKHEYTIVKPLDKSQGEGVERVSSKEALANWADFVLKVKQDGCLIEELIKQHHEMAELNPSSVNTIRLHTIRDRENKMHILGASLRVGGAGQWIDNFSAGGMQYPIDPETGLVIGGGVTHDGLTKTYIHPSTGKQVIGFKIPNWEAVCATIDKAGVQPKDIRYIGWDIAITEDGCEMVEGNIMPGLNGLQLAGEGKLQMIKSYM